MEGLETADDQCTLYQQHGPDSFSGCAQRFRLGQTIRGNRRKLSKCTSVLQIKTCLKSVSLAGGRPLFRFVFQSRWQFEGGMAANSVWTHPISMLAKQVLQGFTKHFKKLQNLFDQRQSRGIHGIIQTRTHHGPLQTSFLLCICYDLCSWWSWGSYTWSCFQYCLCQFKGGYTASFPISACPLISCWKPVTFHNTNVLFLRGPPLLSHCSIRVGGNNTGEASENI